MLPGRETACFHGGIDPFVITGFQEGLGELPLLQRLSTAEVTPPPEHL